MIKLFSDITNAPVELFSDTTGKVKKDGELCAITELPYPLQLVAHKYWRCNFGTMVGFLATYGKNYGLLLRRTCETAQEASSIATKLEAAVAEPAANAVVFISNEKVVSLFLPLRFPDNERNFRCAIYMATSTAGGEKELYHMEDIDEEDYADFLALHQLQRWNGGIARRWANAERILLCFEEAYQVEENARIYVYVALKDETDKKPGVYPKSLCHLRVDTAAAIQSAVEEIRNRADEGGWCEDPDDLVCAALCATVPDRWEYAPSPDFTINI